MPNKVLTIFEGDAKQLFTTADQVETRLNDLANKPIITPTVSPATAASAPIIEQQRAITQAVEQEANKQVEAQTIAAKKITGTYVLTAEEAKANDERMAKFRDEVRTRREQQEAESADRLAKSVAARQAKADLEQVQAFRTRNLAFNTMRRASAAEAEAIEKAQTGVIVRESEKQAAAKSKAILGEGTLGGGLARGAGLSGIGITPAAIGGFAIAAGASFAISSAVEYAKNLAEAEARSNRLRVASNELGIAQKDLSSSIDTVSRSLRITKGEAEGIVIPIGELASATRKPIADLRQSVVDLASARGVDTTALPNVLENIAKGTADTALFGRNAASVFDLYAASIGTTADKLDGSQKIQALTNQLLKEGALNAGAAANATANQAAQTDGLSKAWTSFKNTVGEGASPVAKSILDSLTTALGGTPDNGRFDFKRGGAAVIKDFNDDIEAVAKETDERMKAFVQQFNEDKKLIEDAIAHPTANIVNFSLSKINLRSFLQMTPEQRQQIKQDAVKNAKEVVESQVTAFQTAITNNAGNVPELHRLFQNLNLEKGIIDPDKFKQLAEQATRAVSSALRNMIEDAKTNVPKLRDLFQRVLQSPELGVEERGSLLRSINDDIKQTIDEQKAKVRELVTAIRSSFDAISGREGARNPFLQFLNEADKRMESLIKNTQGFSKELRNALVQREQAQNDIDLFGLRLDARVNAFDLNDRARQFRTGRLDTDDTAFRERQQQLEQQIAGLAPQLQDAARRDLEQQRQNDLRRIAQQRLQDQINQLQRVTGFENISVGTASGGDRPTSPIVRSVPTFEAVSPDQQAIIDKKIIGLAQGVNPADLTPELNNRIAQSLENEAKRQLDAEQRAQTEREKQSGLLETLVQEINGLMTLANRGGLKVDLGNQAITVVEVTTPKLGVSKRSSTSTNKKSTADAMEP